MIEWFLGQEGLYIYLFLFLSLVGGAFGAPIPEDLPLAIGGVLIQQGKAETHFVFLACYSAIILGDLIIFLIGRRFGPALFTKSWVKKRLPPSRIRKMKLDIEKRSLLMIFLARHLFYLRTVTFLACGAVKMRTERFLIADACAALVSVPVMLSIGYFAAEHFKKALVVFKRLEYALLAVMILFGVYLVFKRRKKKLAMESSNSTKAKDTV